MQLVKNERVTIMDKYKFLTLVRLLVLAAVCFFLPASFGLAQAGTDLQPAHDSNAIIERMQKRITQADREAAAARKAAARSAAAVRQGKFKLAGSPSAPKLGDMNMPGPGGMPDYFNVPNWANSPLPTVDANGNIIGGMRKFVDILPGLGFDNRNNLGQYIPIAIPDTNTYQGSDYYEIGLQDYTEQMHSDLPATKLRGYLQLNTTDPNVNVPRYLGPLIIAKKDRPVRVKFSNLLAPGAAGDLFLPVDTTVMGAGMGPDPMLDVNGNPMLDANGMPMMEMYQQNRATLHLHGGLTPWISDGTPHQWTVPVGDVNAHYQKGVSTQNVPDMPNPGQGSMTFYYPNQQTARLMFYHDHAYGITRLNVYAGEAAGYLLTDPNEEGLINSGVLPDQGTPQGVYRYGIPLIVQDKTFVDANNIGATDPTWNWGTMPGMAMMGDLWFPHVYMPNQNPADESGANAFGRWDYGPWFWPVFSPITHPPITLPDGTVVPSTPNPSMVMEAFMDTPLINGAAYPVLPVERKAYRFRILNACNDRMLNLQLYYADTGGNGTGATAEATVAGGIITGITVTNPGSGYTSAPGVYIYGGGGSCAAATATVAGGIVTGVAVTDGGMGFTSAPTVLIGSSTEVKMVPAVPHGCDPNWPATWPTDGRDGGVPDPTTAGPAMIQIGTEGGFLPAPVVLPNTPVGYNYNRRDIVVLNVENHTLFLGPAERADVIIDFSQVPDGSKIILYNDAPAPVPAFDPRIDYYTGDPNQTDTGGAPTTLPGYGPNIRTIMQFQVATSGPVAAAFDVNALNAALPAVYTASQEAPIVPETTYPAPYNAAKNTYSKIQDTNLTFIPIDSNTLTTIQMKPKAIQELFEMDYGRMNSTLGVELPFTNSQNQTTIPLGYIDPPTEIIQNGGVQIWKITHNGVDTHAIHVHLFNVQLINRVGWDGAIRPPEKNELGWKETVRMNPLEDCIVALKPVAPKQLFGVPDSNRPFDPTMPIGSTFQSIDPITNTAYTVTNTPINFGWEYVWHCHLLGHEEMDMMRPMVFNVARLLATAPVLNGTYAATQVSLTWTDATPAGDPLTLGNPANEIGFRIERATGAGAFATIGTALANSTAYTDTTIAAGTAYRYRVVAFNAAGDSTSNIIAFTAPGAPTAISAFAGTSQATISFNAPASNGGSPITLYTVTSTPGNKTGTGASSPITVTGLSNSTAYTFRVTATNAIGTGPASSLSNVVRPIAAPTNLRTATIGTNFVILLWNDNSGNEQGFYIERSDNGGTTWTRVGQTAANTATFRNNGLTTKTTYLYRVQAFNNNGLSNYTNTLTVTTK